MESADHRSIAETFSAETEITNKNTLTVNLLMLI